MNWDEFEYLVRTKGAADAVFLVADGLDVETDVGLGLLSDRFKSLWTGAPNTALCLKVPISLGDCVVQPLEVWISLSQTEHITIMPDFPRYKKPRFIARTHSNEMWGGELAEWVFPPVRYYPNSYELILALMSEEASTAVCDHIRVHSDHALERINAVKWHPSVAAGWF